MKNLLRYTLLFLVFFFFVQGRSVAYAACGWAHNDPDGIVTAVTCGIDGQSAEYYDYSSGADDALNGYKVIVPPGVTVTINSGASGAFTYLGVGNLSMTGGTLAVSGSFISLNPGVKCYVLDSDADGYSASPTTCSTSGGAGYVRKNKLTATTVDCGTSDANANPGQVTYFSGTFTNNVNASLTHDWNCSGVETQEVTSLYTCDACTNGSGYASFDANTTTGTTGYITSAPACDVSGTYYTVTNSTCKDPAVTDCSAAASGVARTQKCL